MNLKIAGATAMVDGHFIFDASILGMYAPWRLRFATTFAKHGDKWKIASARFSTN